MLIGKRTWIIPDGFLQPKSTGDQISHEAVCVLNLTDDPADIHLTLYFEDRDPMNQFFFGMWILSNTSYSLR